MYFKDIVNIHNLAPGRGPGGGGGWGDGHLEFLKAAEVADLPEVADLAAGEVRKAPTGQVQLFQLCECKYSSPYQRPVTDLLLLELHAPLPHYAPAFATQDFEASYTLNQKHALMH